MCNHLLTDYMFVPSNLHLTNWLSTDSSGHAQ